SIYGFNALFITALFLRHRRFKPLVLDEATTAQSALPAGDRTSLIGGLTREDDQPAALGDWPAVTVQLPIFNERFVVDRLIDAACALDYPAHRLTIQVLDDSTDDTTALARARVAYHAARGKSITHIVRADRGGFKAGALAAGLATAPGEFIAIFDADFVPPPDFLRRVIPHFREPHVGAVQARWGHLNAEYDTLTRAQALLLDGHFVVEQTARDRSGFFLNFNGSAGAWRRTCIDDAGGWQADTLAEDMDLSYRAQLRGWRIRYLPEVVAPAEIPLQILAHKRQQFRWAKGSIQCFRKLAWSLLTARVSPLKRLEGVLHLTAYSIHPLMVILVLASLPVVFTGAVNRLPLGALGLAGFGAPLMFAVSQWAAYPKDWRKRFAFFFYIMLLGSGIALNNSWAIFEALTGRANNFHRTPKFRAEGRMTASHSEVYALPMEWTTLGELFLSLYALLAFVAALERAPALAPFLAIYALSFGYHAMMGWWQSGRYSPQRIFSKNSSMP
ncbi:MAG: glycosyltransferase, partial [Chloroflexi bacterium]|nr:glycosyltransferase [Chloroflexota bacterium]